VARTVNVEWQGRSVEAADPEPITDAAIDLSVPTIRRTEQAAAAVRANETRGPHALDVIGRLALRAEGLASSAIEGLRASPADVALAEAAADRSSSDTAAWVADNLAVVSDALRTRGPLTVRHVLAWHKRLMRHAPAVEKQHIGAWRDRLGWVGGANPMVAAHVAVPHESIPAHMDDLLAFVARDDLDPVTLAAVAHAQFETIHPFADGNGRIGRVLVGWILVNRLDVSFPPPVSLEFARDIGGYQAGLTLFRQGAVDAWVRWFADAVAASAERTARVLGAVEELQARWQLATADLRTDAAARRLLTYLPTHPVLNTDLAARLMQVSVEAARGALTALAHRGVLVDIERRPTGAGRPRRWWVAQDLLDLVGRA